MIKRIIKFFKDVFSGRMTRAIKSDLVLVKLAESYIVYYKDSMAYESKSGDFVLLIGSTDREVYTDINQIGDAMSKIAPLYEWSVQYD